MARRPKQYRDGMPSDQIIGGNVTSPQADEVPPLLPSAEVDEAVIRLARLLGRQIAREQIERKQVSKPSRGQPDLDQ